MSTTEELKTIGKGITLLVTVVPEREHAIVRFKLKKGEEPSEEELAAIQFANAALSEAVVTFKRPANFLIVPLKAVKEYKNFGFNLKRVPLPS